MIKSPIKAMKLDMLTFINIAKLDGQGNPILNERKTEKRVGRDLQIHSSQFSLKRVLKVMLLGKLENPNLLCIKGIKSDENQGTIIPLVAKLGAPVCKYKLPFKLASSEETDFEFIFIKTVK